MQSCNGKTRDNFKRSTVRFIFPADNFPPHPQLPKLAKCCFTSTETVGLLGTGPQGVHLDFHTASELCTIASSRTCNYRTMWREPQRKHCLAKIFKSALGETWILIFLFSACKNTVLQTITESIKLWNERTIAGEVDKMEQI